MRDTAQDAWSGSAQHLQRGSRMHALIQSAHGLVWWSSSTALEVPVLWRRTAVMAAGSVTQREFMRMVHDIERVPRHYLAEEDPEALADSARQKAALYRRKHGKLLVRLAGPARGLHAACVQPAQVMRGLQLCLAHACICWQTPSESVTWVLRMWIDTRRGPEEVCEAEEVCGQGTQSSMHACTSMCRSGCARWTRSARSMSSPPGRPAEGAEGAEGARRLNHPPIR